MVAEKCLVYKNEGSSSLKATLLQRCFNFTTFFDSHCFFPPLLFRLDPLFSFLPAARQTDSHTDTPIADRVGFLCLGSLGIVVLWELNRGDKQWLTCTRLGAHTQRTKLRKRRNGEKIRFLFVLFLTHTISLIMSCGVGDTFIFNSNIACMFQNNEPVHS